MGSCCNKNLIINLQNNTKVYCCYPRKNLKTLRVYQIQLEGDLYKICPMKIATTQTDEIFKSEGDLLTFLKDEKGIRTGEHRIRNCFEQILQNTNLKKWQSLIFEQPKVNEHNKEYLFKCLAGSIYKFDKGQNHRILKKIYIPWKQLGPISLKTMFQNQISHLCILVCKP